ncbi:MAG: GNAT family N-acetyltransferase [Anaerolineales bacterium]
MSETIAIRQATLADKPIIFDFLRIAYAGRSAFKFPHRWEWEFERNPFWEGEGLPIWIAVDEGSGRVVGQSCALVEPLVIGGRECGVGWGVDFYVLPDFRGRGIGTKLQAANSAGNEVFMSLSMAQSAQRIKASLGMQSLSPVPAFTKIVEHSPESVLETLGKRVSFAPASILRGLRIHTWLANRLTKRDAHFDQQHRQTRDPAIRIECRETFGDEINILWNALSPKFSALVRRDSEYLDWKFSQQPHMHHEKFVARQDGEIRGYVILRRARPPERNAGIVVDMFAAPSDEAVIRALLLHAIQRFREQDVAYIAAASSVPAYQKSLRRLGFEQTKMVTPMVRAGVAVPHEGWLLGKGDHDWDQYPLA